MATQSTELPDGKEYFNADDLAALIGVRPSTVRLHWRALKQRGVLPKRRDLDRAEAKRLLDYVAVIGRPSRRVASGSMRVAAQR